MKHGTFVGISYKNRKVVVNLTATVMEEFMAEHEITDPKDVIGDLETSLLDRDMAQRPVNDKEWEELHTLALREAHIYQQRIARQLAGDPRLNPMARNTNLFRPRGPAVGDF